MYTNYMLFFKFIIILTIYNILIYIFVGFTHLDHVIRCDNESTTYHIDPVSKRKSVVTLLSRPEHGLDTTRLSYRFVCKTSCLSGMQRRPIIVIFTLEDYTFVL